MFLLNILLVTHLLNGLLIIIMAIGVGILLTRKFSYSWRLYWIGAMIFVLSQILHIPFNLGLDALFRQGILPMPPQTWRLLFFALLGGLSAGLFEECARYAGYRWWAREARSWAKGLLFGAGHGGVEALIIGVLVLINYVVIVALRGADPSILVPAEQLQLAQAQIAAYWSLPWYDTLLGAVERAFTIPAHLAMSVLVLQVFTRGQVRWLWLAIGWHTLLDAIAIYAVQTWGIYATEALLGGMALLSSGIILVLRQPEPESELDSINGQMTSPLSGVEALARLPQVPETVDDLNKTRYSG